VAEIRVVQPTVDRAAGTVSLPGAFWNEKLAEWLDVAVCGRPSDFLHETVLALTTTRTGLEESLREAGFHDADAWAANVQEFPRIRGDRFMVIAEFEREGRKEVYSLDELISFVGWDVPVGPYGFMFKGDPGGTARSAATRAAAQLGKDGQGEAATTDAGRILRDDPQIALTYRGIQSMSQSFADHPLAFGEWVYPMMKMGRNYGALPGKVYDSNGEIPVTVRFKKVTEEELLRESARLWHDRAYADYMLEQVAVAQQLDRDRAEVWALRQEKGPADAVKLRMIMARIGKGYAALDEAWGAWGAGHAKFATTDPKALASLKQEAARWAAHVGFEKKAAAELAIAEEASYQEREVKGETAEDRAKLQQLRGREVAARSEAMLAGNQEPGERWRAEQKQIDPKTDPRTDWIKEVSLRVELAAARQKMGEAGIALGKALQEPQGEGGDKDALLQLKYAAAARVVESLSLRLELANLDYQIGKREGLGKDPELPGLKERREQLQSQLRTLEAGREGPP
jgi:hypothetical protein